MAGCAACRPICCRAAGILVAPSALAPPSPCPARVQLLADACEAGQNIRLADYKCAFGFCKAHAALRLHARLAWRRRRQWAQPCPAPALPCPRPCPAHLLVAACLPPCPCHRYWSQALRPLDTPGSVALVVIDLQPLFNDVASPWGSPDNNATYWWEGCSWGLGAHPPACRRAARGREGLRGERCRPPAALPQAPAAQGGGPGGGCQGLLHAPGRPRWQGGQNDAVVPEALSIMLPRQACTMPCPARRHGDSWATSGGAACWGAPGTPPRHACPSPSPSCLAPALPKASRASPTPRPLPPSWLHMPSRQSSLSS